MKKTKINKLGRLEIICRQSLASEILSVILLFIFMAVIGYCFLHPQKNFERYCEFHKYENNINCLFAETH